MIETGLALIAACLPTLHYIVARAHIRAILSSVRSAIKIDSVRSRFTGSSRETDSTAPYSEIMVTRKISQTSQQDRSQNSDLEADAYAYGLRDVEDGHEIPLVAVNPTQAYISSDSKVNMP